MNKTALATEIALYMGVGIANAAPMGSATFTMYDPGGATVGTPDATVTGSIGGGSWSVASSTLFFSYNWVAHNGTTFGPGTYTIDALNNGTPNPLYVFEVGPGQVGGHVLFDWAAPSTATSCGLASCDIDVIQVWDISGNTYTSGDPVAWRKAGNGSTTTLGPDGLRGTPMIDGAFNGFNANFDFTVVPVPAAVWLFGSGLLGLVGVARRKKSA